MHGPLNVKYTNLCLQYFYFSIILCWQRPHNGSTEFCQISTSNACIPGNRKCWATLFCCTIKEKLSYLTFY